MACSTSGNSVAETSCQIFWRQARPRAKGDSIVQQTLGRSSIFTLALCSTHQASRRTFCDDISLTQKLAAMLIKSTKHDIPVTVSAMFVVGHASTYQTLPLSKIAEHPISQPVSLAPTFARNQCPGAYCSQSTSVSFCNVMRNLGRTASTSVSSCKPFLSRDRKRLLSVASDIAMPRSPAMATVSWKKA
jgi:hypothetical protein